MSAVSFTILAVTILSASLTPVADSDPKLVLHHTPVTWRWRAQFISPMVSKALIANLGITQKKGKPGRPTPQGKIERFWQTLKRYLAQHLTSTLEQIQQILNGFQHHYNDRPRCTLGRKLRHLGIRRTHARTPIILLVQDLHITITHTTTGEILRELTINPDHDYQPTSQPPEPTPKKK